MDFFNPENSLVRWCIVVLNGFFCLLFFMVFLVGASRGTLGATESFMLIFALIATITGFLGGLKEQLTFLLTSISFYIIDLLILVVVAFGRKFCLPRKAPHTLKLLYTPNV